MSSHWILVGCVCLCLVSCDRMREPQAKTSSAPSSDNISDSLKDANEKNESKHRAQSDDERRLALQIRKALFNDSTINSDLNYLTVTVQKELVVLDGRVFEKEQKKAVEEVINKSFGINKIENNLEVVP